MTIDERVRAEDDALRTLIRDAGERAPLGGGLSTDDGGGRAVRLPAPSRLVFEGRRLRARRRARALGLAAVATVTIAVAAVGAGAGAFTLPWLRADGSTGPSTVDADSGPRIAELSAALDRMLLIGSQDTLWVYTSGPNVTPDDWPGNEPVVSWDKGGISVPVTTDRMIGRRLDRAGASPGGGTELDLTLTQTEPGDRSAVVGTRRLGAVRLAPGGQGSWLQVRPSAEDGWLVIGLLPADASAVQVSVAGTGVVLPLSADVVDEGSCRAVVEKPAGPVCREDSAGDTPTVVHLRFATANPEPPIDAMTYIDRTGAQVVLGTDAGRTVR